MHMTSLLLCKEWSESSVINLFLILWLQQNNKLNLYAVKTGPKPVMDKQHGLYS